MRTSKKSLTNYSNRLIHDSLRKLKIAWIPVNSQVFSFLYYTTCQKSLLDFRLLLSSTSMFHRTFYMYSMAWDLPLILVSWASGTSRLHNIDHSNKHSQFILGRITRNCTRYLWHGDHTTTKAGDFHQLSAFSSISEVSFILAISSSQSSFR